MDDLTAVEANDATAELAYDLWEMRGRPFGSSEIDWLAAEAMLAEECKPGQASVAAA
jgi:hypothetical protein